MWPVLFGSGWLWEILLAAALLCFVVSVLGFLLCINCPRKETADPADQLWHRYGAGDITRSEFERLRRRAQGQQPK
jgi:uncharacterized membrane protein